MQIFKNIYFKKRGALALIVIILCSMFLLNKQNCFPVKVSLKHPQMND